MNSTKLELVEMISIVARSLAGFSSDVCFVGGTVACLYCDMEISSAVRPTKDVDCVIEVLSRIDFYKKEDELRTLGFKNDMTSKVVCRWKLGELIVDIMPTDPTILNFSNRWYEPGFRSREECYMGNGTKVNLFPLPYYLATKFEALGDRGGTDWRVAHDLEDILFVLGSSAEPIAKIVRGDKEVRTYLAERFKELSERRDFEDILSANFGTERSSQISKVREVVLSLANEKE